MNLNIMSAIQSTQDNLEYLSSCNWVLYHCVKNFIGLFNWAHHFFFLF